MANRPGWNVGVVIATLAAAIWLPCLAQAQIDLRSNPEEYRESVVVVRHGMRFDAELIQYPDLIRWFEGRIGFTFARDILSLQSGSGFYISTEGHVLTNDDLARFADEDGLRNRAFNTIRFMVETEAKQEELPAEEISRVLRDVYRLVHQGTLRLEIVPPGDGPVAAEIVFVDAVNDIAVIKSEFPVPTIPLPVAPAKSLEIGNPVTTIGYQLEDALNLHLPPEPTVAQGEVTAVDPASRRLDHSGKLSIGQSGGPLLDSDGRVIGLIVSRQQGDRRASHSIPSDLVIDVLETHGLSSLVEELREAAMTAGRTYELNARGRLAVGPTINVNTVPGLTVLIDNEPVGTSPVTIENLTPGPLTIRVENALLHAEHDIEVDSTVEAAFLYAPRLERYFGSLVIDSSPPGAAVFVDNRELGSSPVTIERIATGEHLLDIRLEGYFARPRLVTVAREDTTAASIEMVAATRVVLDAVPDGGEVTVSSATWDGEFVPDDPLFLPDGEWQAVIRHPDYDATPITITVPVETSFRFDGSRFSSTLEIVNLFPDAVAFIGNDNITAAAVSDPLTLPVGSYSLRVERPTYQTMEIPVTVERAKPLVIELEYTRDRGYVVRRRLISTAISGVGSGVLVVGGFYLNADDVAVPLSGSYGGYKAIKIGSLAATVVGMAAGATAVGFLTSILFVPR